MNRTARVLGQCAGLGLGQHTACWQAPAAPRGDQQEETTGAKAKQTQRAKRRRLLLQVTCRRIVQAEGAAAFVGTQRPHLPWWSPWEACGVENEARQRHLCMRDSLGSTGVGLLPACTAPVLACPPAAQAPPAVHVVAQGTMCLPVQYQQCVTRVQRPAVRRAPRGGSWGRTHLLPECSSWGRVQRPSPPPALPPPPAAAPRSATRAQRRQPACDAPVVNERSTWVAGLATAGDKQQESVHLAAAPKYRETRTTCIRPPCAAAACAH